MNAKRKVGFENNVHINSGPILGNNVEEDKTCNASMGNVIMNDVHVVSLPHAYDEDHAKTNSVFTLGFPLIYILNTIRPGVVFGTQNNYGNIAHWKRRALDALGFKKMGFVSGSLNRNKGVVGGG